MMIEVMREFDRAPIMQRDNDDAAALKHKIGADLEYALLEITGTTCATT
jgi:hypothetical protein